MTFTVSVATDTVECRPDQPILDALLRGSVWMPNSCNQGTCGTCKLRVVSGSVDHGQSPEDTLTPAEREQGFALACQATPCSDTVVERLDAPPAGTVHALRDLVGTVSAIEDVARDTRRVLVTLDSPLEFSAGQYVELRVPGTDHGRQYSMANTPGESKQLEFHIRRQPGGVATDGWVFGSMSVGEPVEMVGPLGDFRLDPGDEGPMILLGGGTGLAPLKSIIRHALSTTPGRAIHLYHGVREEADLYDVDLLREWERAHRGFRYVPCLSGQTWSGRSGYVSDAFVEDFDTCRGYSGYLCGPPAMVDAGVKAFKRRRMAPRRIFREKFACRTRPSQYSANA
ncbi:MULTISPECIES: 2Fe-2S iron-sulfur cluster-binding protein [unclassified Rhodococcus (in: high G+C Gram-positive bacteria)]|uniref:2Fe-2S iron-sulfur cluster-binding protein n=1 Tax=unclassified Rhodococcus (in: high G+C Gram-positive bacteria) TaxID=192944 RepID=UPI00163A491F|nr:MULTISPECIES: 2Fe-2S iron-sulfur cluster-binding protein [unclassified Rhodococcus (in: high G+C Gram-positive bacteria)]MBC2642304.1 2Fe-2S iron-sulfur cluster binding domain-containing protein [Rhodococcus sp. 3A]MBC2892953.1 2Fe-2S iron-sulfur cluster binding domain-containing protein [Rhodococcus sp. 4CII]